MSAADITFAIGEVAAMLGISPHTLRAWERRHMVVQPLRTTSGQRRYTHDEVELLRQTKHERHVHGFSLRMAALTAQGVVVPDAGDDEPARTVTLPSDDGDPLRMVADLVSEVVVIVDAGGRIVHANTAFVAFSGVMLGQLRGATFADFAQPFDRAKAVQVYQAPLRQRRGWELGLRTPLREAFFSFDCWPVASAQGAVLVLIGRSLTAPAGSRGAGERRSGAETHRAESALVGHGRAGAAAQLSTLLDGVADPLRTLGLVRRWLDDTREAVVLSGAGAPLTVLFANRAFGRLLDASGPPAGDEPWHAHAAEGEARRLAAGAAEAIESGRPRTVAALRMGDGGEPAAVWDVDVCPVVQVGGGVGHLVLVIADVTAESAVARRLDALMAFAPVTRRRWDPRELLRMAAPHAGELLPNAGSLVALTDPDRGDVRVVAASGACAPAAAGGDEPDLRLALVRDAVATRTSIEVERAGSESGTVETFRVVPLLPVEAAEARRALGALAFLRVGANSFSPDDRQLIDEFAGRLGLALARCLDRGAHRWRG